MDEYHLTGNIVDLLQKKCYPGILHVKDGEITSVIPTPSKSYEKYIMPGFIDAHVHIESSLLMPSEFARLAVTHGTIAAVATPQDIAHVLGMEGIREFLKNSAQVPFYFCFGVPSSVPSTSFETSGHSIDAENIRTLFNMAKLRFLGEVKNYRSVLDRESSILEKMLIAKEFDKPIDGHAPGLRELEASRYIVAGAETDHECQTLEEALDKIRFGMKILIREGSLSKNFEELHHLIYPYREKLSFCTDHISPSDLAKGHINAIVRRAVVEKGYDLIDVLLCACYNPVVHYQIGSGLLQIGDPADFIVVDDITNFNVEQTYIRGALVAEKGKCLIPAASFPKISAITARHRHPSDFRLKAEGTKIRVMEVQNDDPLHTTSQIVPATIRRGYVTGNLQEDILKIVVVNRYHVEAPVSIGFIKNFKLQRGAIASSMAHDANHMIALGTRDEYLCQVINGLIDNQGGLAVFDGDKMDIFPLPIAGLLSDRDANAAAKQYDLFNEKVQAMGCTLPYPFMTLSFLSSLTKNGLRISDKGLFDADSFQLVDVQLA
jgi:adenine deaminase